MGAAAIVNRGLPDTFSRGGTRGSFTHHVNQLRWSLCSGSRQVHARPTEVPIPDQARTSEQQDATNRALDRLFVTPKAKAQDFNFGPETTNVFDDMVDRSVPY